ncbi:MAG: hypothetical protein ACYSP9_04135 [Planctomycetota bacterium]|jgi:hypothetical protein
MDRKSHKASDTFPELMVQQELIEFLRIPEITKAEDYSNVVENLKRMHGLPCIHICKQPLYPLSAVRKWISEKLRKEQPR